MICIDCGRKRDPHRPIVRLVDGTVLFTCRQCWRDYGYLGGLTITAAGATERRPAYMVNIMSAEDRVVMARARR